MSTRIPFVRIFCTVFWSWLYLGGQFQRFLQALWTEPDYDPAEIGYLNGMSDAFTAFAAT